MRKFAIGIVVASALLAWVAVGCTSQEVVRVQPVEVKQTHIEFCRAWSSVNSFRKCLRAISEATYCPAVVTNE